MLSGQKMEVYSKGKTSKTGHRESIGEESYPQILD